MKTLDELEKEAAIVAGAVFGTVKLIKAIRKK